MMRIKGIARLAVFVLVAALAVWALYLIVVGLPHTEVRETVSGGSSSRESITHYLPYYGVIYSVTALMLVAIGVTRDKWLPLAWVGLLAHLAVGAMLIWGMGIIYIAATGVLTVPVGILQWQSNHQKRWLLAAWVGAGITVSIGTILLGSIFGIPILAIGILLSLLLVRLQMLERDIALV